MRVREWSSLLLCVIGAACAGRTVSPTPRSAQLDRYRYNETVSGAGGMTLSGEFVVLPDTVVFVSQLPAPCPTVVTYPDNCDGAAIYASSADPIHSSRYRVVVTTQKQERTCEQYTTDEKGNRVCQRWETHTVDVRTPRTGLLHVEKVSGDTPAKEPDAIDGRYSFSERIPGSGVTFDGEFVVLADTVTVNATPGPCAYLTSSDKGGPIAYRCQDITLNFDRRDPLHRAQFNTIVTTQKPQTVCLRYEIGASGQRVCAQSETKMIDVKTPYSGTLRPHRVVPGPAKSGD